MYNGENTGEDSAVVRTGPAVVPLPLKRFLTGLVSLAVDLDARDGDIESVKFKMGWARPFDICRTHSEM